MLKNNLFFFKKTVETQIPQNFVDPQFLDNEILFTEYDTNLKLSIILSDARVSISITKEKNKRSWLRSRPTTFLWNGHTSITIYFATLSA